MHNNSGEILNCCPAQKLYWASFKFIWAIHLIYTPPYGREFLRGVEKAISEGLCASASFDLCFLGGCLCRHFDLFFLGVRILLNSSIGGGGGGGVYIIKMEWPQNVVKWTNSKFELCSNARIKSKPWHPPPGHTWGICLFSIWRRREFDLFF